MWIRSKESLTSWFALVASAGTLLCCALPVLLVALGFGALVAGLTAEVPWLAELSRYKEWLFAASALLLAGAGWSVYRPGRACPSDPVLAERCARLDRINRRVLWTAVALWSIGFFAAYVLLFLLRAFGW